MTTTVDIIGGAVTGPTAAYALARQGFKVKVYEQQDPSTLISAGILGIDPSVWYLMRMNGLDPDAQSIPNMYRIFGGRTYPSPYFYIPWRGLHQMLVDAGQRLGVEYRFGARVKPDMLDSDYIIDATGVAGAARDHLPFDYTGRTIYRGPSQRKAHGSFIVFQDEVVAFTTGDAYGHANWTLYTTRPEPPQMRTVMASVPPEVERLPLRLRRVVMDTPTVLSTPMSHWSLRPTMHSDDWRIIYLGDCLGAIEPVTTAGAALAVMEGFEAPFLLPGGPYATERERACLARRDYVLKLGRMLARPEIGGYHEDDMFGEHELKIYGQPLVTRIRHREGIYSR